MRPNHEFSPARRAALHCAQLVAREIEAESGFGAFARFGKALAPRFAGKLPEIFAETGWEAEAGPPEPVLARDLAGKIDKVAGNFLLPVGDAGGRLLASFRLGPVRERLEAIFGGHKASELPEAGARLPRSLTLLLARLERALTEAVLACLDESLARREQQAEFATDFARLAVFPGQAEAVLMPLRLVSASPHRALELHLACRKTTMTRLLAHFADSAPAPEATATAAVPPAIGEVPLRLRARLAELKLPAGRLLALRPGQILPLPVGRSVPLYAGGRRIASGLVGEADDRVALQIEQVFLGGGVL